MRQYIASFYTHYAALATYKSMTAAGVDCTLAPVPRRMSSSCGTCLRITAESVDSALLHADFERLVLIVGDGYETVLMND